MGIDFPRVTYSSCPWQKSNVLCQGACRACVVALPAWRGPGAASARGSRRDACIAMERPPERDGSNTAADHPHREAPGLRQACAQRCPLYRHGRPPVRPAVHAGLDRTWYPTPCGLPHSRRGDGVGCAGGTLADQLQAALCSATTKRHTRPSNMARPGAASRRPSA